MSFDKMILESKSIYELRTLARNIGVKSPTTKKHHELVQEILDVQNGEKQAQKSNMGRKPKNSLLFGNDISKIIEKKNCNKTRV